MKPEDVVINYIDERLKKVLIIQLKGINITVLRGLLNTLRGFNSFYLISKAKLLKQQNFRNKIKERSQKKMDEMNNKIGSFMDKNVMFGKLGDLTGNVNEFKKFLNDLLEGALKFDTSYVSSFLEEAENEKWAIKKAGIGFIDEMVGKLSDFINIIEAVIGD